MAKQPTLSFITFSNPSEAKLPNQRRAVKSHAASWTADKARRDSPDGSSSSGSQSGESPVGRAMCGQRKRRRRKLQAVVLDAERLGFGVYVRPNYPSTAFPEGQLTPPPSPTNDILGQGGCDPFRTYPVAWEPFIPELIDHYFDVGLDLKDMAVDMPELDEPGNPGLLRTRWFPLVMSEAPIFEVILLLAASHYSCLRYPRGNGPNLLRLKSRAIASINEALKIVDRSTSDQLIGAVAKMASYEALYGDQTSFEFHMQGLVQMIDLRGGLVNLGLGGLLARICVWIDNNSAFLHCSLTHFTDVEEALSAQANPSAFIAAR